MTWENLDKMMVDGGISLTIMEGPNINTVAIRCDMDEPYPHYFKGCVSITDEKSIPKDIAKFVVSELCIRSHVEDYRQLFEKFGWIVMAQNFRVDDIGNQHCTLTAYHVMTHDITKYNFGITIPNKCNRKERLQIINDGYKQMLYDVLIPAYEDIEIDDGRVLQNITINR